MVKSTGIRPLNQTQVLDKLIMALIRLNGALELTKPLAHAMGLRRRQLRARVALLVDDGQPVNLHGRNLVSLRGQRVRLTLDLDAEQILTLIAALRHTRDGSHTRQSVVDAAHILHRIAASLPPELFAKYAVIGGFDVAPMPVTADGSPSSLTRNLVTAAIQAHVRLRILYTAADGARTDRIVWPVTLTYHGSTLLAWCEQRQAFRHFRLNSIAAPEMLAAAIPRSRQALLAEWRGTLPRDRRPDDDGDGD